VSWTPGSRNSRVSEKPGRNGPVARTQGVATPQYPGHWQITPQCPGYRGVATPRCPRYRGVVATPGVQDTGELFFCCLDFFQNFKPLFLTLKQQPIKKSKFSPRNPESTKSSTKMENVL